jgi:MFS family permease
VLVMMVLLYRNYFNGGNDSGDLAGVAAVAAASGVGTVLAAFVTPRMTRWMPKSVWISVVLIASGVVEVAFGLPFSSSLFVLAGLLLGFSAQASKICVDTIVQEQTDDAYRGRAFSLYDLLFNVAFVAAAALAVVIVPENGRSAPTVLVTGTGYALCGLLYLRAATRHPQDMVVRAVGAPGPQAGPPADRPVTRAGT